jgi:hypothetical protein
MATALNTLKDQLKLDPKLSAIANKGEEGNNKGRQKENKKSKLNQSEQKKDEVWKKELQKDSKKKEKQASKYTNHSCEHHMAWIANKPAD